MSKKRVKVLNKYKDSIVGSNYIGRGSPLGNPYPITKENPRVEVIQRYSEYLDEMIAKEDPTITKELDRLTNIALVEGEVRLHCFCKPKPCHGDVIAKIIEERLNEH